MPKSKPTAIPKIGDAVLCDGALCLITDTRTRYAQETGELLQAVQFENTQRKHYGLARDLRWDDELSAWYLWGRCLGSPNQAVVIELRDRGLLPARSTRTPGNPPAGGEHRDLWLALFAGRSPGFWDDELARVRSGKGGLSPEAAQAVAHFTKRWTGPHEDGYADPQDPPSAELASLPKVGGQP